MSWSSIHAMRHIHKANKGLSHIRGPRVRWSSNTSNRQGEPPTITWRIRWAKTPPVNKLGAPHLC